MKSVAARMGRGGSRKQSRKPTTESRQPSGKHREAAKPPLRGLEAAELEVLIEELRLIEHTIATLPGLVEHARAIANAFECDEPERRDPIARLSLRLTGRDVDRFGPTDMRMPDDDLLEGMVDAANAVTEAATWRLQRLCRVLFRVSEKAAPGR